MLHRPSTQTGGWSVRISLACGYNKCLTLNGEWSIISGQRSHGGGFHERRGRTASTLKGLLGFRTAASSGFSQKMNNSWGWKFTVSRSDARARPATLLRMFGKALMFAHLQRWPSKPPEGQTVQSENDFPVLLRVRHREGLLRQPSPHLPSRKW